jgi:hydroxyacylglutathione hydrolase
MRIVPIKAFSDNYIWLILLAKNQVIVIDPGDAEPVLAFLQDKGYDLTGIWLTHHHHDHIGGVKALQAFVQHQAPCPVCGPAGIALVNQPLRQGLQTLSGITVEVLDVSGHTAVHFAYFLPEVPALFAGDALFAAGCGRIFDGHPNDFARSIRKLAALPPSTLVYCAHEYTQENLEFCQFLENENQVVLKRQQVTAVLRALGQPTVPTLLALELLTNPFLRAEQPKLQALALQFLRQYSLSLPWEAVETGAQAFATLRFYKDCFDQGRL